MLTIGHVKHFERTASSKQHPLGAVLYAAGFALMCHGSLRYGDTGTLTEIGVVDTVISGTFSQPKAKYKSAGRFFCLIEGFATKDWYKPVIDLRKKHTQKRTPNQILTSENGQKTQHVPP